MEKTILKYRYFFLFLSFLIVVYAFFIISMSSVKAADSSDYYSLSYLATSDDSKSIYYHEYGALFTSPYPLFLFHSGDADYGNSGYRFYSLGVFKDSKCFSVSSTNPYSTNNISYTHKAYQRSNGSLIRNDVVTDDLVSSVYFQVYSDADFTCSGLVFDSLSAAEAYYLYGDRSGLVFDSDEDSVVDVNDLYLTGVKLNKGMLGHYSITWTGTSLDDELLDIPDDDTIIVVSMIAYDKDTLESIAIPYFDDIILRFSDHKLNINMNDFLDYALLDPDKVTLPEVYLSPCYRKDYKLYSGRITVVDLNSGEIKSQYVDDDGEFRDDVVTPGNGSPGGSSGGSSGGDSFSFSDITDYTNKFFSFLKSLINSMGSMPSLFATVFSFMPSIYVNSIGVIFLLILILRVLGR